MAEAAECCILGICCDPTLPRQALADQLDAEIPGLNAQKSMEIATFILAHYDLAPKGLLSPLLDYVAAEAREYPYRQSV